MSCRASIYIVILICCVCFFFNDTATTEIYTLSLHDALPILRRPRHRGRSPAPGGGAWTLGGAVVPLRSEEHTSELQSLRHLVCRLLLEKKKKNIVRNLYIEYITIY